MCLASGSGCAPQLLAGVLGCVCVCVCVRALLVPRHFWLRCAVWVGGLGPWLRLRPATPGSGVGGYVCACVRAPLVPRHPWLGCAPWMYVLGLGFRLRPATSDWRVGLCACLCARPAFIPPLLAGVCGVGGCAWALASAAPRHSWLGCWGVCVLVCAPRLYPATPGWGVRHGCVCLGSHFGCAPLLLAGVLGCVCAGVRAPLLARHSWLRCAVWVGVLGPWLRLRPAIHGWVIRVCVCLCARPACTPPPLAGMCGVGVCVCTRASAAPHHFWLGCWGVCVLVCAPRLYPATPGWAVEVCVFVCARRLYPGTPGWHVRCGCVCLGAGFGCAPQLMAGVLGCVCAFVCVLRWCPATAGWRLRCGWVCVMLGLEFRLRRATPCWGVGVCVCVCVCALRLYCATSGWGVLFGCVCLGSGLG